MSVADIFNLIEIDDSTATAGQPTEGQFRDVREAGYAVVVNLAPDGLDTSLPDESSLLRSLGFDYHHIPVPWGAPDLDHLDQFIAAMDAAAGRRTLVHCQANFASPLFMRSTPPRGWAGVRRGPMR